MKISFPWFISFTFPLALSVCRQSTSLNPEPDSDLGLNHYFANRISGPTDTSVLDKLCCRANWWRMLPELYLFYFATMRKQCILPFNLKWLYTWYHQMIVFWWECDTALAGMATINWDCSGFNYPSLFYGSISDQIGLLSSWPSFRYWSAIFEVTNAELSYTRHSFGHGDGILLPILYGASNILGILLGRSGVWSHAEFRRNWCFRGLHFYLHSNWDIIIWTMNNTFLQYFRHSSQFRTVESLIFNTFKWANEFPIARKGQWGRIYLQPAACLYLGGEMRWKFTLFWL